MSSRFALGLSLLLVALFLVPPTTGAEDENAKGKAFRFSVMGDNRPRTMVDPVTPPEEFRQAIREANLLRPDLSVILGDLIMGYTADEKLIEEEWDAFDGALAGFEMPVRLVVGNHDVWDVNSKAIYERRYGAIRYSFVHEGCRFIVLDSEDLVHRDKIAGEQLEWLKGELAKGGRRIFVFLHKPFWRYEQGQSNWMEDVHPLLAKAGADAVFAGHWHNYERSKDHDGVRYYITGGAGAEIGECEYSGDFFHHLIVDVPADDAKPIDVHVLKTGFLAPDSVVTEEERQLCYELAQTLLPAGIEVTEEGEADAIARIKVVNPWKEEPLLIRHEFDPSQSGAWRMDPDICSALIPPGGETEISMRFRCAAAEKLPGPVLRITATRGDVVVGKEESRVSVRFKRTLEIAEVPGRIEIDGRIDEEEAWKAADETGRFLSTMGDAWAAHLTRFWICRDDEAFYLAFRCEQKDADKLEGKIENRDWQGLTEDCLVFYLDPVRDGKSRFCFGVTAMGVPAEYRAPGGARERDWDPDWPHAVTRDAEGWTLEARVPYAILDLEPKAGMEIGLNAIRLVEESGRQYSAWFIPMRGVFYDPKGFGTAVLK